jgi:sodium-independent sulfate anion transporter 11
MGKFWSKTFWIFSIGRNALIVIITSIVAFSWADPPPFAMTGTVKSGFPPVKVPPFELPQTGNGSGYLDPSESSNGQWDWDSLILEEPRKLDFWESIKELGSGPLSIAVISILQNVAIAKAFGSGQSIDANQEMIALGVSHLFASFFSAIPTSGSFTRSAVNEASGVKSPFSGIFTGKDSHY